MKGFVLLLVLAVAVSARVVKRVEPEPQGVPCTICNAIVGYAEDKLGSNSTLQEIENFLNTTVCSILPSFLQDECDALVDEFAPEIAQKIFQGLPPSVICKDIGLCSSRQAPMPMAAARARGAECSICTLIVGYAEDHLASNSTLQEIENFLNNTVCHLLPRFLRSECDALVDQYAPQIAQKILQGAAPETICTDIGLCSSPRPYYGNPMLLKKLVPVQKALLLHKIAPGPKPELLKKLVPAEKAFGKPELLRKLVPAAQMMKLMTPAQARKALKN